MYTRMISLSTERKPIFSEEIKQLAWGKQGKTKAKREYDFKYLQAMQNTG